MGLNIARDLLLEGANVTLVDVKEAPHDMGDGPGRARFVQGDITDDAFVKATIDDAFAAFGRLDYLVNAAGVLWFGKDQSLVDIDLEIWNRVIAINLTGSMLTSRHAVPKMKQTGGGSVVHFSTMQCYRGDDKPQDAYQASKAAVIAMSKSLAIQFAPDRIRSNVIVPGPTESPMQARWSDDPALRKRTADVVPLGRVGTTQDMANACLYLLSEKSSFVTGTELIVDGGWLARP